MAMTTILNIKVRSSPTRNKPVKVFESGLFETFVARIVRRRILDQFVDPDHPILVRELNMIDQAIHEIKKHLDTTVNEWGTMPWRLRKIIVVQHLRELSKDRISQHDVEDEVAEQAIEFIYQDDFESLFPSNWLDG